MNKIKYFLIVNIIWPFFLSANAYSADCSQKRMGMDIGSGSTKIRLALVDVCQKKIEKILFEKSIPIAFKDDLSRSTKKQFSEKIVQDAVTKLKLILDEVDDERPFTIYAVATSAFRDATNAKIAAKFISKSIGSKIKIIDQKQEGLLGFVGASSITGYPTNEIVVWDIGGGSQQITILDKSKPKTFLGKLASGSFKNYIISKVQKKDLMSNISPNPISFYESALALNYLFKDAKKIPKVIKEAMLNPHYKMIGIGGVHNNSMKDQLKFKDNQYTIETLEKSLKERIGLTDKEVGGDYFDTDISNLLYVYGMMGYLGIKKVETVKVTMAEAVILHPEIVGFK